MSFRPGQAKGPSVSTGGGGGGGGAISFGANVGTGTGEVFKNAITDTLYFRTLLEGVGITITTGTDEVTIGLDAAGTTNRIVKWLNGTGTLADSLMLEQTDGILLSTAVASPGVIQFDLGDEGVTKVSLIKEASTQDFVIELSTFGEVLRLTQADGFVGISTLNPTTKLHVSDTAPVYLTLENQSLLPTPGTILGGISFYGQDLVGAPVQYGYIEVDMTTPGLANLSDGTISIAARHQTLAYRGLSVSGAYTTDISVHIYDTANDDYAVFDGASGSLTIGHTAVPDGILNLFSDTNLLSTQQICYNVGDQQTSGGGAFFRNGKVRSRKDVGLLENTAVKDLTPAGTIGYGHVWASTAAGFNDHVNQVNFSFDYASISMYNTVGDIANSDTALKLCVYMVAGVLTVKNNLGGTRTFGYDITYYDNPDLVLNVWIPIGYVRNWRSNAMSSAGTYQTAVAENDYIYRSIDGGLTFAIVDSIRHWYSVSMDGTGQYQYAIEGRDQVGGGRAYRSTNYGASWTLITDAPLNVARRLQHITNDSTGHYVIVCEAGVAGRIYYSADYGVTWTLSNAPAKEWGSVASDSSGALMYASVFGGYIYKSTDFGATWSDIYSGAGNVLWDGMACSADGQYITAVIDGGLIYISSNGGTSFASVATVKHWHEVAMSPSGQYQTVIINFNGVTAGGVYYSDDYGATWTQYSQPADAIWWGVAMASDAIRTIVGKNTPIYIYT